MSERSLFSRFRRTFVKGPSAGATRRRCLAALLSWGIPLVIIVLLTAWLMRNWLWPYVAPERFAQPMLPTSSRREVLTEMAVVWMFTQELGQGDMLNEWNPYWFSGFPWLRFLSYPVYYLVAGLALWSGLALDEALVGFYFLVMAGSGISMYLYLRKVLCPPGERSLAGYAAALIGACIYELFPYHNHVGVETWIHAAFWVILPLALWAIESERVYPGLSVDCVPRKQGAQEDDGEMPSAPGLSETLPSRIPRLFLIGLILALFPIISSEYALIAGPFVVLYLVLHEFNAGQPITPGSPLRARVRDLRSRLGRVATGCAIVGLVAIGVSAFFWLPGLLETHNVGIHAKHAQGTTFSDELLRDYSVTPSLVWYAVGQRLNLPGALRLTVDDPQLPSLVHSFWSVAWYPGLFVTFLALLGLGTVRRHFAAAAAAIGLVLAILMASGPTFALNFFNRLPVIGRLSPFRSLLLVVTFMSILAGFGVRWLLERLPGRLSGWMAWVGRVLGWRALADLRSSRWIRRVLALGASLLITVAIILDLSPAAGAYQTTAAYFSESEKQAYAWLAEHGSTGRLWEASALPRDQYLRAISLIELPMPRFVGYYDNGAPLHTWQQTAWTELAVVLHLHQVRYVLLRENDGITAEIRPQLREANYAVAYEVGDIQIWENPDNGSYAHFYSLTALDVADDFYLSFKALPPLVRRGIALIANDVAVGPGLRRNQQRIFDLRDPEALPVDYLLIDESVIEAGDATVILPRSLENRFLRQEDLQQLPSAPAVDAWVWPERLSWGEIHVETEIPHRGVLTVAESWYPHWRVTVDGEPRPALRVNWALLGVRLEPGLHRVDFGFQRPWYVLAGYAMSFLTLAGMLLWWTHYLARRLAQPRLELGEPYPALVEEEQVTP